MTKTVNLKEVSIESVIALTRNGDEVIVEEDGAPVAKITPIKNQKNKKLELPV
ncbi:MAG TPA: hypothetical protein VF644_12085 [Pyrinomonadaceae bacterium]|jgi:antitoxin (DNA-binding transcriptional repressor) of toxin-antitoxin stability system